MKDYAKVLQMLKKVEVDMIILDLRMPKPTGSGIASEVVSENYPEIKILTIAMYDDSDDIVKMLKSGVKGSVLKNTTKAELIQAIETVAKENTFYSSQVGINLLKKISKEVNNPISKLTKREIEIIKLIVKSMTNKEIAGQLFLSELTVKTHRQNAMQKLEVKNTAGLVRFAMDNHLMRF